MSKARGILLYSGGLDSLLAARVLMDQDIELQGLHFILPFEDPYLDTASLKLTENANKIGLSLVHYRCGSDYLEMLRNPDHGYGKNINPCIDCKIFFIKKAAKYMKESGADFVATGEVVGQRPMSQLKHTLKHIINATGLKGRLLRPLSAKLLPPTIPEQQGLIDREMLKDFNGRSRKPQLILADYYGITDYDSPSGGCLFTEPVIARRIRDLFTHHEKISPVDIYQLTLGRNFRISSNIKIIVGRNEKENVALLRFKDSADCFIEPDFIGPCALIKGIPAQAEIRQVCAIIMRYSKKSNETSGFTVYSHDRQHRVMFSGEIPDDTYLDSMRI